MAGADSEYFVAKTAPLTGMLPGEIWPLLLDCLQARLSLRAEGYECEFYMKDRSQGEARPLSENGAGFNTKEANPKLL